MINLLPDDYKKDIRTARANVVLLRYNILMLVSVAVLVVICIAFYFILTISQASAVSRNTENSSKASSFQEVRTAADEYRSNLSVANSVLSNSVNYTTVIFEITKLLPSGVVLDTISLSASDFGKQMVFATHAKSYSHATQLKESFQSSKLFSNVYFQNITDTSSPDSNEAYPVAVTLSAQLNKVPTQ